MGRYFNENPDELVHGQWKWPNGNNSKDYNHYYYENHKAKWDRGKSVDQNIADNLANYGYQANGPDQPGLSDDFQRILAKRRMLQLDNDVIEKHQIDGEKKIADSDVRLAADMTEKKRNITDPDVNEIAYLIDNANNLYSDVNDRKNNFDRKSLTKAVMDVPLAAVDTLVQAGKSMFDKIFK